MEETITATEHPNGKAPSGTRYRMGAKGGRVAEAWQDLWDRLSPTVWVDGTVLAAEVAQMRGLKYTTLAVHLQRMAAEGLVDYKIKLVRVPVERTFKTADGEEKITRFEAPRRHAFYRLGRKRVRNRVERMGGEQ